METIVLNGDHLSRKQVVAIAQNQMKVSIDVSRLAGSRDYIVNKVKNGDIVYGVTTGFGSNADIQIREEDALQLQLNLLRSHACGVGKPLSGEIVRAVMTIRLNTLLKGFSGVQESTVRQLEFMLNAGIHPVIPEQGSLGASGDLCPLSHMTLPMLGEGEMEYKGITYNTEDFLLTEEAKAIGFKGIQLSYKEGLALNNGTSVMAAIATLALDKAERILKTATLSSALIFESLGARKDAFAYQPIHDARLHGGQSAVAGWLSRLLEGSRLIDISQMSIIRHLLENKLVKDEIVLQTLQEIEAEKHPGRQKQIPAYVVNKLRGDNEHALADLLYFAAKKWKPQDAYSIRCIPQVFGASKAAIDHAAAIIDNELNAAVDNPLIFAEDDKVISGGNFHGQPIALVMDYLKLAVAEIGNIVERQINKLVDGSTNDGLPSFLINDTGLNSGLMIPQYAAASVVSENKVLVHPASADSIPSSENTEDHVSMGSIAARQALQIGENVEKILSIAILTGYYAVSLRLEQFAQLGYAASPEAMLSPACQVFFKAIREADPALQQPGFLHRDRYLAPAIRKMEAALPGFCSIADRYIQWPG